jgi:predicted transcriptional regulator
MGFDKEFSDSDFLNALSGEFKPTAEIKKIVGCSHKEVDYRLNKLVDEGKVIKEHEKCAGRLGFRNVWKLKEEVM